MQVETTEVKLGVYVNLIGELLVIDYGFDEFLLSFRENFELSHSRFQERKLKEFLSFWRWERMSYL